MIGNRLEQDIIKVFQDNITETYSINALSKILGKAYPYINRKTNFFIKEGIIRKINLGNSYQCFLNLRSEKTKIFMMMNEMNKRDSYLQKHKPLSQDMDKIQNAMDGKILILFDDDIYTVGDEEKTMVREGVKIEALSKDALKSMIIRGRASSIIVLDNIEGYVNIISGLGDEILLKGLIREE